MNLLEILLKKLPESAGWPKDAACCIYHAHKEGATFYDAEGEMVKNGVGFIDLWIPDVLREEVTREQYEAALTASKPEWTGVGLPPVGTVCEYIKKSLTVKEWTECTIDYVGSSFIVYRDCYGVELTAIKCDIEFRPIRSEADKKRAEGVIALSRIDPQAMPFEYGDKHSDGSLIGPFWYELYDAIASGKIPHIRID